MCGIAGFVGAGDGATLTRMTDALVRRGPDGAGEYAGPDNVFLGHRRLSILDHGGGAQPMRLPQAGLTVVFNGEIYNFQELRQQLMALGHEFFTDHSDTEVLLHGYRQWGTALAEKLNGMWAFALLDETSRTLWLSRDRFGKKPLYYHQGQQALVFGSELSALRQHPAVPFDLSRLGLQKYFAYGYAPSPHTVYENIRQLRPGHHLLVSLPDRSVKEQCYWRFVLEPDEALGRRPVQELAGELLGHLEAATASRMVADVPVGIFLSGGIDSSTIAALAARHTRPGELLTFSIGFEEKSFDESGFARQMATALGTKHHEEMFSLDRALAVAPQVLGMLDHPMGDSSLLPTALLCHTTRRHATVALGGDGADELFAGYDPFKALRWAQVYARLVPRPLHRAIALLAGRLPTSYQNISLDFKLKRTLSGLSYSPRLWNAVWMGPLAPAELGELFGAPVNEEEIYSEAIDLWDRSAHLSLIDRTLAFFTGLYLMEGVLVKVDRASMMHSLEVRSPFLDLNVVEFARRLPARLKFEGGQGKVLLREAARFLLPPEILNRKKKGFGVPVGAWFRQGRLLPTGGVAGEWLQPGFFQQRLKEHQQGRADHRLYLWNQLVLEQVHGRLQNGPA